MITVTEALDALFALVSPLATEDVPLRHANGRVLARDVAAQRTQPPFAASSMDGYAVKAAEVEADALFKVIGESAAGHRWDGVVGAGQAVRIFTGAPVPQGADFVVIQEDTIRRGDLITLGRNVGSKDNIRAAGVDFTKGTPLSAPRLLTPADIALLASMNIADVPVVRRPVVSLISTGDELVMPGEAPGPDQIIASNTFGLAAMLEDLGAHPRILPIAADTEGSLRAAFDLAKGSDLVITVGGASVGDHDLVAPVAAEMGMEQSFYKVAMRPGKPLMAGRLSGMPMVGLPGNPVSAMVCGSVFIAPLVRAMQGLPKTAAPRQKMTLAAPLTANGPREHYMRGTTTAQGVISADLQDSSLLSVLSTSDVLIVRPAGDPARAIGDVVETIAI
ncbi:Molybdopterin molybdenumtransferase [Ascidiaceihabitans donghaensis]|uniref:Molybdopterin molybdenumtransferase n=1 Tax=Ascidiaceihabitans donghaensis TaxID=1510460 RepID=A0A2R8BFA8_9RHOB|nr:gephyrin-like molybdotransferase Glp [Ascidiaceihabitans donghaensis]SPH21644.1 Molybdopterin molybdenumtransferase [Ascidiaceihabitans donghaensis]